MLIHFIQLLVFNPEKRPSAESCLTHSYVARFNSKKDNLKLGYNVIPPINDDVQLTVDEYRQRLYAMIRVSFLATIYINIQERIASLTFISPVPVGYKIDNWNHCMKAFDI